MVVEIRKSPNGDSRTAIGKVSFEDFAKATDMHRDDVKRVMYELARRLREIADSHDYTKKIFDQKYYEDYIDSIKNDTDFHDSEWFKNHIIQERHHIKYHTPDDINLLDILEAICDHCCDDMSEKGKVKKMEIDEKVLMKSFDSTVNLVKIFIRLDD